MGYRSSTEYSNQSQTSQVGGFFTSSGSTAPTRLAMKEAGKTSFTSFTKGLKMALTMEPISAPRARTLSNAAERAAIIAYKKWEAAKGSRWMPLRTAKLLC